MLVMSNIALADLTTDKAVYMPGDTVQVNLSYPQELSNFQLSVIGPNNTIIAKSEGMKNISSNVWSYKLVLGARLANESGGDFASLKPAIAGACAGAGALLGAAIRWAAGNRRTTVYLKP